MERDSRINAGEVPTLAVGYLGYIQYQEKNYFRKFDGIHHRALSILNVEWFIKFPAFAMTGKLNNSSLGSGLTIGLKSSLK